MSTTNPIEEWRPVVGYEGFYEVSDMGLVRSLAITVRGPHGSRQNRSGGILAVNQSGNYPTVKLSKNAKAKTIRVHRLVLEAFVGPCPDGMECRHFPNRSHDDNRLANLSWGTKKQNAADRELQGQSQRGELGHTVKLKVSEVERIRTMCQEGKLPQRQIAAVFGICQAQVSRIFTRTRWAGK